MCDNFHVLEMYDDNNYYCLHELEMYIRRYWQCHVLQCTRLQVLDVYLQVEITQTLIAE